MSSRPARIYHRRTNNKLLSTFAMHGRERTHLLLNAGHSFSLSHSHCMYGWWSTCASLASVRRLVQEPRYATWLPQVYIPPVGRPGGRELVMPRGERITSDDDDQPVTSDDERTYDAHRSTGRPTWSNSYTVDACMTARHHNERSRRRSAARRSSAWRGTEAPFIIS
jgi:hypothetical protein